jgi:hypothetical protein
MKPPETLRIGDALLRPRIENGWLQSLGTAQIGGKPLRHPANRWLPWFDTYEGEVFRQFRLRDVSQRGEETIVATRAVSDPDVMFREFRDTSGDLCFRQKSWDAAPVEAELRVHFLPVTETVDGRAFTGFKYWFEYEGAPIHRLIDRQTWELGGNLDDVTICLRSWLTKPRLRLTKGGQYSTAGFEHQIGCMPGNMWARWSLLPAFDMQYGRDGVLLAWFDRVSLIRTVIETMPDEDWLRVVDSHWFESSGTVRTNAKTIVWSPDRLDDTDALNLWTRLQDREHDRACAQFGIRDEPPPQIVIAHNQWVNFRYASTYENSLAVAAELGADYLFVDPPWENMEALRSTLEEWLPEDKRAGTILAKLAYANMCATLDWRVADVFGGERELKALCDRAAAKGVKIISWMALHNTPYSYLRDGRMHSLGHGRFGVFAAKESGHHPDTGYPGDCWPLNLHAPVGDWLKQQILGVCQRTGLAGFLWDSFSNLGWWQVDYSQGDMRPQFDKMAALYAALVNAGLYLTPEGQVTFSNASMLGMHGGNTYEGDLLGYSYHTATSLWWGEYHDATSFDCRILRGQEPVDMLFQCFAHKRAPMLSLHHVPRAEWNPPAAAALKELFATYKAVRHLMQKRTVLKDNAGVLWENAAGQPLLFSFTTQKHANTECQPNKVYRL